MRFRLNPVLDRELKERVRGRRAAVVLTIYLALLSLLVYAVYWSDNTVNDQIFQAPSNLSSAHTGRLIFDWLVIASMLLTCFIVPGLTAAGVAGERDRQTLVPLQVTLLKPRSIVIGKLLAALSYLLLLLVATMPLMAVALLLGGITLAMIVKAVFMIAVTGVVLGSLSLACSALFRRVQGATVAAYALTLLLVGGTVVAYGAIRVFEQRTNPNGEVSHDGDRLPLLANPVVGAALAVMPDPSGSTNTPLAMFSRSAQPTTGEFDNFGNPVTSDGLETWLDAVAIDAIVVAISITVATRKLRTPRMTDR